MTEITHVLGHGFAPDVQTWAVIERQALLGGLRYLNLWFDGLSDGKLIDCERTWNPKG